MGEDTILLAARSPEQQFYKKKWSQYKDASYASKGRLPHHPLELTGMADGESQAGKAGGPWSSSRRRWLLEAQHLGRREPSLSRL